MDWIRRPRGAVWIAAAGVAVIALGWLAPRSAVAGDWPGWRGPEGTGASRESDLPAKWQVRWSAPHGGRSTPVVHQGRLFVINRAGRGIDEQERLQCFDARTGDVLWEHRFSVFLTDIPSTRIGWASPVIDPDTGYVYAHGVENTFTCLDRDGRVVWSRQLHEEYGTINGYGGRTHTPIVDEDSVIVSFLNSSWGPQAVGRHRYVSFDKRTGSVEWWATPGGPPLDTTYATPVVAVVGGVRQLIAANADGWVYGMKVRTGETIWKFGLSKRGINASVVVADGKVYVAHSEENLDAPTMGRVVCIDASGNGDVTKTHEVWRVDELMAGYASPAVAGGRVYVADNSANLWCYEAGSGKKIWQFNFGTVAKGSPVVADGKIYLLEVNGNFLILEDTGESCRKLTEKHFATADGTVVEMFGSPAIAGGRVYFNSRDALYCIGDEEWKGTTSPVPALAAEGRVDASRQPVVLQVLPADVTLQPGQSVVFRTRAFDPLGRPVDANFELAWSAVGIGGQVASPGRLKLADAADYSQGFVVAHHGALEGRARVRVVPRPALAVDFEKTAPGKPPAGFVGAGIKFVGAVYDGEKVLTKPGERSKFMDAETFFGLSTWSDYTVQADVLAIERKRNLPNIGLVNSGYEFVLMGNHQRLRIVSWVPQPRLEKREKFRWDPKVWYRMKFRVEQRSGVATLLGKVWKRDDPEPVEWTLRVEDPNPNGAGGPGLHGYSAGARPTSAGAQIYYDNVRVTWNQER